MTDPDKLQRMYQVMARLAEIEYEREMTLRRREREAWAKAATDELSARGIQAWVTRRANLAAMAPSLTASDHHPEPWRRVRKRAA